MNNITVSQIINSLVPNHSGYTISGDINDATEYANNVVFNDEGQRPAWASIAAQETEYKWIEVRAERERRLIASDWTVLPDVPLSTQERALWETYRQELRDVTSQPNPDSITWPSLPQVRARL